MLNISIVEDETDAALQLEGALKQYSAEYHVPMQIHIFANAITFLDKYAGKFDLVFMDIMMPMLNGMDAAHALREKDSKVMLVFVTSMVQYAIQGYEVSAADFIVKPVRYLQFKLKFTRMLDKLRAAPTRNHPDILVKTDSGIIRLMPQNITYVEVRAHHCIYHTRSGDYRQYQTMKSAAELLEPVGFAKCNNYLLVNLAHVTKISGMTAYVAGEELPISHPRKNEFTGQFAAYSESRKYE